MSTISRPEKSASRPESMEPALKRRRKRGAEATVASDKAPTSASAQRNGGDPYREPKSALMRVTTPGPIALRSESGRKALHRPDIRVFQVYFDECQRPFLDAAFKPIDNRKVCDPLLEVGVMRRLHRSADTEGADYWGVVSWKFKEKMSLEGLSLLRSIEQNPDFDVYFCNPFVEVEALYQNLWVQGAVAHPNFLEICEAVFRGIGMDPARLTRPLPSALFATSNYFVANSRFWDAYMAYVESFLARVAALPQSLRTVLYTANADPGGLHHGVPYLPFIVERLLTEFLMEHLGQFRALKVKSPALEKRQTVYYNNLRMLKDAAIVAKSDWMLDCWSNYRKVLLGSIHGKRWMDRHLPVINRLSREYCDLRNTPGTRTLQESDPQ